MPDRHAQERLADWRAADRAEKLTPEGSVEQRRAHTKTRRARWEFEDAARAAGEDHGLVEPDRRHSDRVLRRLGEASRESAALNPALPNPPRPESRGERKKRLADEAEIASELDESR
jgi:hypothetical protein